MLINTCPTAAAEEDALASMYRNVVDLLLSPKHGFTELDAGCLGDGVEANCVPAQCDPVCPIYASGKWQQQKRLLLVLPGGLAARPGVWSRSVCLSEGLQAGSMLGFLDRARKEGFGVLVLNPSSNYHRPAGGQKLPVPGSSTPVEHVQTVWRQLVLRHSEAQEAYLVTSGSASTAAAELVTEQLRGSAAAAGPAIMAVAALEARRFSHTGLTADAAAFLSKRAVNWQVSPRLPAGAHLAQPSLLVGCPCVSAGRNIWGAGDDAWAAAVAVDGMFRFFDRAAAEGPFRTQHVRIGLPVSRSVAQDFVQAEAAAASLHPRLSGHTRSPWEDQHSVPVPHGVETPLGGDAATGSLGGTVAPPPLAEERAPSLSLKQQKQLDVLEDDETTWNKMVGMLIAGFGFCSQTRCRESMQSTDTASRAERVHTAACSTITAKDSARSSSPALGGPVAEAKEQLRPEDFEALHVVGKGAFGRVLCVALKADSGKGGAGRKLYAMKVLSKVDGATSSDRARRSQHARAERSILCDLRHPFIVRLRYAFQTPDKLYLVTDFFPGGSLFYHLRMAGTFAESRARFYAAEVLLALEYLHERGVVYRDLKPENVVLDARGHIALCDFGLSTRPIGDGSKTFCGTAEYLAPEVVLGQSYGRPVDYWSFGILLCEMIGGRSPFYHAKRHIMFRRIVAADPALPPDLFSSSAGKAVKALLRPKPAQRAGSTEVRALSFFKRIDWAKVLSRSCRAPFVPDPTRQYVPRKLLEHRVDGTFGEDDDLSSVLSPSSASTHFKGFTYTEDCVLSIDSTFD